MASCTHPAMHIMYDANGRKWVVCTPCGQQWEV